MRAGGFSPRNRIIPSLKGHGLRPDISIVCSAISLYAVVGLMVALVGLSSTNVVECPIFKSTGAGTFHASIWGCALKSR